MKDKQIFISERLNHKFFQFLLKNYINNYLLSVDTNFETLTTNKHIYKGTISESEIISSEQCGLY